MYDPLNPDDAIAGWSKEKGSPGYLLVMGIAGLVVALSITVSDIREAMAESARVKRSAYSLGSLFQKNKTSLTIVDNDDSFLIGGTQHFVVKTRALNRNTVRSSPADPTDPEFDFGDWMEVIGSPIRWISSGMFDYGGGTPNRFTCPTLV